MKARTNIDSVSQINGMIHPEVTAVFEKYRLRAYVASSFAWEKPEPCVWLDEHD